MFRRRKKPAAAEPASPVTTEALKLTSGTLSFLVGFTTRRAIEGRLGPAIEYPAPGWRTWAAAGSRGDCWVLSAFYRDDVLIGIEHYLTKTDNLPRYTPPANGVFRLMPGDICLGNRMSALGDRFLSAAGRDGGPRSMVYLHAYESRWPHGIAFVCGNDGRVERIALYASHEMPTIPAR